MTMTEPKGFIGAIGEDLYDDTPRLVYADWLEEHGDPDRAEFIRLQCELEPMRDRYEIDRAAELHRREEELLRKHQQEWLGPGMEGWDRWREDGASAEFRRGFVDTVAMPVRTFLARGAEAKQLHPTIRRVVLYRVNGNGERLAACPALAGLAELELACWYSDADARAISSSPHLARLQVLELWLGRRGRLTDSRLCQIMAGSKAWPILRELTLLNPNDENERGKRRLVTLANKAAGRKVAVYRRGWPELFPFAADFWYTFPGYLPDGRRAMAAEDHRTSPPTLCVLTFDRKGKQTDEVLTVALPDDLLATPVNEWYAHKERMEQHLIETIGFRPGFIRIQDCQFPGDEYGYDRPYWEVYSMQGEEEQFGVPDAEDEDSWTEYPCGYAGQLARRLRDHEYVFGWDRYADKRGKVHST
jgi:uncharacterized protein (TIGR02996 family)